MKHFGDITKINGAEVPMVDIITGGSPCQDLSVAGKVAGLEGDRSKLFLDQIRVVKEMRDECIRQLRVRGANVDFRLLKPRFMVWENVPNALSSPGKDRVGEDFRVVLEEIAKIADQNAIIPRFENGKWSQSGCILADRWSIAWRVHDAQFWGVPQRRKRLCLVADFTGQSAGEILFERKVLSGDNTEIRGTWEAASGDSEKSIERTDKLLYRKTAHPINKTMAQGYEQTNKYDTLNVFDNSETRTPMLILENHPNDSRFKICEDGIFPTLSSRMGTGGNNVNMVLQKRLRRLTPLECERLQGFPDGWTDIGDWVDSKGRKHKSETDSIRYKALGNSIALPFWQWMAGRIAEVLREEGTENPTMASLFSGIGGFELVFSRCGVEPVWNSEIESFPEAVTTKHFGDEERGIVGDYKQYL